GGPLWPKHVTFFFDSNKQQIDTNAVIDATILDPAANIVPLQQAVVTPQSQKSFSPRVDYQIGQNHTGVLRYGDTRTTASNSGVGEFSLLSRGLHEDTRVQLFQLAETAVLSSRAISETRAQLVRTRTSRNGNNLSPTINVPGAFTGGGADIGAAYNRH